MKNAIIDDNNEKKPATKVDEGLHEVSGPSGNGLNDGIHGEMRPCFDRDACAEEGHENTDISRKFFEPGKVVVKGIAKDDLNEGKENDHEKGIGQNPFFKILCPLDNLFHVYRKKYKNTAETRDVSAVLLKINGFHNI
jgi:hypothetical protein